MPVDVATVVWLVEGAGQAAPGDAAMRELAAWGEARGVRLEPAADAGPRAVAIDWSAGEKVERGIARVRDALAGLDFDAAERELARAEAVVHAHPELPQAAWLRAEIERAWSVRWLREDGGSGRPTPDSAERAKRAWQRAAGLDGGRAPGLGETAFESAAPIAATVRLVGESGSLSLRLDGANVAPGDVKTSEGEHALAIVTRDGETAWAEWVSFAQGAEVRIAAPESPACSRDAMAHARLEGETVRASGVRCGAWIAAVARADGSIGVARCAGESCDALVEWRAIAPVARGASVAAEGAHFRWPAWATWTLAGVSVVGASVAIAAAAGAFRSSPPPQETQFVNGGLAVHSF